MTAQNRNGRTVGEPVQPQRSKVSDIHTKSLAHADLGVSSDGYPFPKLGTCKAAVLACLLSDDRVTHRTFDSVARSMRAAVYVARLRTDGWPIDTTLVSGENRFESVRYARYALGAGVTIGDPERVFVAAAELAAVGWL